MWHSNKTVIQTFSSNDSQNGWANIQDLGWRKIKTGATDGVTNTFILFNVAKANARKVNVYIIDNLIERAYLN